MDRPGQPAWQLALQASWQRRGALTWALWPLSLLMDVLVRFRQGLYLSGLLKRHVVPVPVVVVGNVVAGGAGKTPVVIALVQHLQSRGMRPGVISRGYGRHTRDCREVLEHSPVREVGDEPALIRRKTGVPVYVAARRIEAARALLQSHPQVDILVSDDGLQHLALARDLEVCVFDDRGVGNGFLLPAGPLREPWPRYVDLVLHTGNRPAFTGYTSRRALAHQAVRADGSRVDLVALAADGRPLLAVAGTARPQAFFDMLQALGLPLTLTAARPDHDDYASWQRPRERDYTLLCTEKDALKLWAHHPDALAVPLEFEAEPAFYAAFDRLLDDALQARLSSPHGHPTA
ncbi:MAG: tetraacyldisaccharide 4'-kinase [Burkholderiaceae bacterium]|nr:tetraacyldisaccharide 4'-kinase [Burkholderiaceae bacterium]